MLVWCMFFAQQMGNNDSYRTCTYIRCCFDELNRYVTLLQTEDRGRSSRVTMTQHFGESWYLKLIWCISCLKWTLGWAKTQEIFYDSDVSTKHFLELQEKLTWCNKYNDKCILNSTLNWQCNRYTTKTYVVFKEPYHICFNVHLLLHFLAKDNL